MSFLRSKFRDNGSSEVQFGKESAGDKISLKQSSIPLNDQSQHQVMDGSMVHFFGEKDKVGFTKPQIEEQISEESHSRTSVNDNERNSQVAVPQIP